jgi:hypothetical protein
MSVSRIVLAVAFAAGLATSMTVAQSAEPASGPGCGWNLQNGRYVFLGTCPDEGSSNETSEPAAPPAPPPT